MHLLQKCMQTVFVFENWKPFSLVHFSILLRQFCISLSTVGIFGDEYAMAKSSTYRNFSIPVLIDFVMLLILRMNSVIEYCFEEHLFRVSVCLNLCFHVL